MPHVGLGRHQTCGLKVSLILFQFFFIPKEKEELTSKSSQLAETGWLT